MFLQLQYNKRHRCHTLIKFQSPKILPILSMNLVIKFTYYELNDQNVDASYFHYTVI